MLSKAARKELIRIVRETLANAVYGGKYKPADPGMEELQQECGCFVTYKTDGQLRGCIGCFTSTDPLYKTVAEYAILSATQDCRFVDNRIRPNELPRVELDISILSPLERCDNPKSIELGRHGIYVKAAGRSGCFLPQVATETGWSIENFWGYCCSHKAGLPYDAWKSGETELFTFTAEVITDTAG